MNYHNTPLLRVVLPYILGVVIAEGLNISTLHVIFPIGLLLYLTSILYINNKSRNYKRIITFGLISQLLYLVFGLIYTINQNEIKKENHFTKVKFHTNQTIIQGIVLDDPVGKQQLKIRLNAILDVNQKMTACTGNLLVYIKQDQMNSEYEYGDELLMKLQIRELTKNQNPKSFDYKKYLHYQNIHFVAYTEVNKIKLIRKNNGNIVWRLAYQLKNKLLKILSKYFPTIDEYAVATALLLGYKEDLSDELKTAYSETGSMHALAVSGTHVGLLYGGMVIILGYLPLRGKKGRALETFISLIVIWGFTFVTGASASVLRASIMFSIYLVGKMIFRQANVWNVLSGSAFILLVYNPLLLFDAGFQLSYTAVAGLAYFYPLLYKASPIITNSSIDSAYKVLLIGIAAQLGTLPLSLYYFHQFPTYFWLSGWVVVLGGALFLWAGSILIIIDGLIPKIAIYLGDALYYLIWGINKSIRIIQDLPGSLISGLWIEPLAVVLLASLIISVGIMLNNKSNKSLIISLVLLVLLTSVQINQYFEQLQTSTICIYALKGKTLIDLFHQRNRLSIANPSETIDEEYTCKNHRWSLGTAHTNGDVISWKNDTSLLNMGIKTSVVYCGSLRLAIIDPSTSIKNTKKTVDAILLVDNPIQALSDIIEIYPCSIVIADGSNSKINVSKWKENCSILKIPFYYTQEQGAWIKQITN
jgi:competence protein ComEC